MYQEAPRGTSNVTATFIIIIIIIIIIFFFEGGLGCVYVERGGGEGWRNKKLWILFHKKILSAFSGAMIPPSMCRS